ncbi:CARDB domain-containing protein [Tahibacter sp.]|uniref:CARDB domain-containing protein n=1 Tax=Tahibacter sp. TaxID=2056211 RepID=UPI0028C3D096|nr:CARDB domain-containing protein [Tahibacter sp.]
MSRLRFAVLLHAAAATLLLYTATAAAATDLPLDDCVHLPDAASAQAKVGAVDVGDSVDIGNLSIIELDGDYARGLDAPRMAIARRFYETHADRYDFIVTFTTFEFETSGALAFYNTVRNDVQGIGGTIHDFGSHYGSATKLQGYVDMAAVGRYADAPGDSRIGSGAHSTLAHEIMHRWGSQVSYRTETGATSTALLGQLGVHWSYFLDTDASIMYGADWVRRSDGSFHSAAVRRRFSPLDLYLAGFASAAEVPPMQLIVGGDGSATSLPRLGAISGGTAETVRIEQIIAAEGPRIPDAAHAQKDFRVALILLKRRGENVAPATLAALEGVRVRLQQYFNQITDGRASLRIYNEPATSAAPQLPVILSGSGTSATPPGVVAAVAWIQQRQHPDGHWQDRAATALRDTTVVVQMLQQADPGWPGLADARAWLAAQTTANRDQQSWQLALDTAASASLLIDSQSATGGWGLAAGFEDSTLDTALVADALARRDADATAVQRALAQLVTRQNSDGSFALAAHGRGRLLPTLHAARLFAGATQPAHQSVRDAATQWLASRQRADGSFGDTGTAFADSALADTIELYGLVGHLPLPNATATTARDFVMGAQQTAGDWQGSIYLTATAALAQLYDNQANLAAGGVASVMPADAVDGDVFTLQLRVVNAGSRAAAASSARWYDGDPASGGNPIGSDQPLPALAAGAATTLQQRWDSAGHAGARTLWLALDVHDDVVEQNEADNRIAIPVTVGATPAQADIALDATLFALTPPAVASLPATIRVSGSVRNLGNTPVAAARLVLYDDAEPPRVLAMTTLALPARGSAPLELEFTATASAAVRLRLVADPDATVAEARENNNEARLLLPFGPSLDLEVRDADLTLLDATPPTQGRDVGFRVQLRNRGTLTASNAALRITLQQGASEETLFDGRVTLEPGQTLERRHYWRAREPGAATLRVQLDAGGEIAELDESNNLAQWPFTIAAASGSDLAVVAGSLQFAPEPALQGAPLQASLRVRNDGGEASGAFTVALFANDPRSGGARLAQSMLAGLAAQAETNVVVNVADLGLAADTPVFVAVDADQQVAESDEGNNLALHTLNVLPFADIAVSSAAMQLVPSAPAPGAPQQVSAVVRNLGAQAAQSIVVRLFEGNPETGVAIGSDQVITELVAGAETTLSWNWNFGLQPGARQLSLVADPAGTVRENQTLNNLAILPLALQDAAFYASERFISPNGDGVRDATALFFARTAAGRIDVVVRNTAGREVRRFDDLIAADATSGQVVWDGRDQRDRVVADGVYVVERRTAGQVTAQLAVTVDTDRSSLVTAIDTPLLTDAPLPPARSWFQPPATAATRDTLFARALSADPLDPLAGIYRTSTIVPELAAVVSSRWLSHYLGADDGELDPISAEQFSPDGRWIAFYVRRGSEHALAVAATAQSDQVIVLDADAISDAQAHRRQQPRFLDANRVIAGAFPQLYVYDLQTRARTPLRALPDDSAALRVHAHGLYIWRGEAGNETPPAYYVPHNAQRAIVTLPGAQDGEQLSIRINADGTRAVIRRYSETHESLELFRAETGSLSSLRQRIPEPHTFGSLSEPGYLPTLQAQWIAADDSLLLVDAATRRVQIVNRDGAVLSNAQLPPTDAALDLGPDPARFDSGHRRADTLYTGDDCDNTRTNCSGALWSSADRREQWFDPATRTAVVLLASAHIGPVACEAGRCFGHAPATLEAFAIDVDEGHHERLAAMQGAAQLPADLQPRLRLIDGGVFTTDSRYGSAGSLSNQPWRYDDAIESLAPAFSGDDASLVVSTAPPPRTVTALVNLSAQLFAEPSSRAVRLSGVAADLNFAYYTLDWAVPSAPTQWHAITPPQNEPVLGDEFLSWIPPQPGQYLVRLRVVDKAGNATVRIASTLSSFGSPVFEVGLDSRYFSPNGDEVKDIAIVRFRLTTIAQTAIRIRNALGEVVRERHSVLAAGPQQFIWDGRSDGGQLLADGDYVVDVAGQTLKLVLDTTPPVLTGRLMQPNLPSSDGAAPDPDYTNQLNVESAATDLHLDRFRYELRALDGGDWREALLDARGNLAQANYGGLTDQAIRATAYDRAGNHSVRELGSAVEQLMFADCLIGSSSCSAQHVYPAPAVGPVNYPADFPQAVDLVITDPLKVNLWLLDGSTGFAAIDIEIADARQPGEWSLFATLPGTLPPFEFNHYDRGFPLQLPWSSLPQGADRRLRAVGIRADGSRLLGDQLRVRTSGLDTPLVFCPRADLTAVEPPEVSELLSPRPDEIQVVVPVFYDGIADGVELRIGVDADAIDNGDYRSVRPTAHNARHAYFRFPPAGVGKISARLVNSAGLATATWADMYCSTTPPTPNEGMVLRAGPVYGERCASVPTQQWRFVAAHGVIMQHYDLALDGAGGRHVLLDETPTRNDATAASEFPWMRDVSVSTAPLPEGSYLATGMATAGTLRAGNIRYIEIDRDPAQAELDWPSSGSRVCAARDADGFPALRVGTALHSDSAISYQLSLKSQASDSGAVCPDESGLLSSSACHTRHTAPTATWIREVRGNGPAVADLNGRIEAELEVGNASGAVVCSATSFDLDSIAELGLGGAAEPHIGIFQLLTPSVPGELRTEPRVPLLGLSVNGAPRYRNATIPLIAREPLSYRATLHALVAIADDGFVSYQLGSELAPLGEAQNISGAFQVSWNGHVSGNPVSDGHYAIRVQAGDACGWTATRYYVVDVDSTPPTLAITSPAAGAVPTDAVIAISGTVDDAHFSGFPTAQPYWQLLVEQSGSSQLVAEDEIAVPQPAVLGRWSRGTAQGAGRYVLHASDDFGNTAEIGQLFGAPVPLAVLGGAQALPALFSPNGDGRLDQTQLRLQLLAPALVDVRVRDDGGAIVAELAQNIAMAAGTRMLDWNGGGLPDGHYVVEITARSAAQPDIAENAALTLDVDTVAPQVVDATPADDYANSSESASFRVVEPRLDRFDARLAAVDGGAVVAQLGGSGSGVQVLATLDGLAERAYRFNVLAQDRAGNQYEHVHVFTLDATPPEAALTAPMRDSVLPRGGAAVAITGSAQDAHVADYRVELLRPGEDSGDLLAAGTTAVAAAALGSWNVTQPDGDYRLRLRVRDRAGNTAEATQPLAIDGTPPVVTITAPTSGAALAGHLALRGSVLDAHLRDYRVAIATPSQALSDHWTLLYRGEIAVSDGVLADLDLALPDGDYVLRVLATDATGAVTTATRDLRLDRSAPAAPLQLRARLDGADAVLDWSPPPDGDLAGYAIYRNGARLDPALVIPPHHVDAALADGLWRYEVSAIDRAGNESARSNRVELALDRTPPEAAIHAPLAGSRVHGVVAVAGTAFSANDFDSYVLTARRSDGSDTPVTLAQGSLPQRNQVLAHWNTLAHAEEAAITLRLAARDRSGNEAASEIALVVDNLAPAAPQGLVATLQGADGAIAWTANTEPDLLGYLLYRNGRLVNGTAQLPEDLRGFALTDTSYLDAALADGTHRYVVFAIDRAGNLSMPSNDAAIGPIDNGPPHLVIDAPDNDTAFETSVDVRASSRDGDIASVQFAWRAAGASDWTALGAALSEAPYRVRWTPAPLPHGDYEIRAIASDTSGLDDPQPPQVRVRYADLTAPAGPGALLAVAEGGTVQLSWTASADPDVVAYRLERLDAGYWQRVGDDDAGTTRSDTGRDDGRWTYRVSALDAAGNRSDARSDAADVFSLAVDQPFTPTTQATTALQGRSALPGRLVVRVGAGTEQDAGPTGTDGRFALDAVALDAGDNVIVLHALTNGGDRSRSATRRVTRATVPAAPTGVQASAAGYDVSVHWNSNAEADVIGYRVEHNGGYAHADDTLTLLSATSTTCCDAERSIDGDPATHWDISTWFEPLALDAQSDPMLELDLGAAHIVSALELDWRESDTASGNVDVYAHAGDDGWVRVAQQRSAASASLTVALPTAYRSDKLRLVVRSPLAGGGSAHLTLTEVRVRAWHLVATTTFEQTVLDGQHRYRVAAVNASALQSAWSAVATVGIGDITPPDPVVLGGTLAGNTATLTWSASAAPDVARYVLSRDDHMLAEIAANAERRHVDANLALGDHAYTVVALDAFGNASEASNRVILEVAGSGPGIPQAIAVVAPPQGASLQLSWNAGDGSAAVHYLVRRAISADGPFAQIASVTATTFADTPLTNGTRYHYTVEAVDAAGNRSGASAPASGVPRDALAPAAPVLTYPVAGGSRVAIDGDHSLVCGRAEAGSLVEVRRDAVLLATTTAAAQLQQSDHPAAGTYLYSALTLAADGWHLADTGNGYSLRLVDLRDGQVETLAVAARLAQWSAHGVTLYYVVDDRLQTKQPGRAPQSLPLATEAIHSYAIAADESRVLLYGRRASDTVDALWWLSRDGATVRPIAGIADYPVDPNAPLRLRADARYASLATTDGRLVIVDLDAARALDAFAADTHIRPSWSPDGMLGFTRSDAGTPTLWTYDPVTRRADPRFVLPPSTQAFAWSPDGSEFALLGNERIEGRIALDGSLRFDAVAAVGGTNVGTFDWAASARIVVLGADEMGQARLYSLQPPGAFCAGPVALRAGTNRIDAVATDAAGNRSGVSLAQQVDVDAAALPDIALSADDMFFVPATPAPGQRASALVTVRNRGGAAVADVALAVSLRAPDGSVLPVTAPAAFALAAGGSRSLSLDLGVLAHSGHYRLRLIADPDARITERDETNNSADSVLAVSDGAAPLLDVALAGTLLAPGAIVSGEVRVTAPGTSFDGRVRLQIIATDGTLVADLGETPTAEIAAGQTWTRAVAWNSTGVLAGDYRLHARLLRRDGSTAAERDAAFAIEAVRRIDLAVATLPSQQPAGTNVAIESRLHFADGNALLAGATLRVSAHAESGAEIWAATQALGTLQPGYELRKTDRWDTRGLPPGVYALRLRLSAPGYDASTESSVRLVEAGTTPPLTGALTLAPDGRVVAGRGDTLVYRVDNAGAALAGLQLRLRVLRTPTLASAFEREETFDLGAGASREQTIELGVPPLALGSYITVLDARLPGDAAGSWRDLARLGFAALDEQAPAIVIQSPVPDSLQPALVSLRALITDAHSDVTQAHARVDDGSWQPLALAADGRWSLLVGGLADGAHRVSVRARDRWNNESVSEMTAFAVDATAPQVTIAGIDEGALTNQITTPTITIADAHLDSTRTSVRLNGAPYVSGTPVSADGSYTLAVQARDTAGNETFASLHFTLDRTPPALAIASPADASVLSTSAVDVIVDSEADARVALQVGAFSAEQSADAAGRAVFTAVPLVEGDNPIDASATDRAGNTSPTRRVTVRYEAAIALPLVGTLQPGQAELAHGTPLQVALQLRNPGTVALPEQSVRLRVVASDGSVLAQRDYLRAFAGSETFADTADFATTAWPLGSVDVHLGILRESQWNTLDTQSVQIVDRTPPLLQAIAPLDDAVIAAPLRLRAQASDALSAPVVVDASIDSGAWSALAATGGDSFEGAALKLTDGAHSYRLRARDAAGNETPLAAIPFNVDNLAPQIAITGVADGDLVNHTVTPQIDVSDAHLATTTLRLNGQPYASGSAVTASGAYLLRVEADDAAGNRATREVAFTIDREAPGVVVDAPVPGSTVTTAAQEIAGRTEPDADVAVQAPGLDTVVRADANGVFRTAAATLLPGANTLHLRATDRAGNVGDAVTVAVSYVPPTGEALAALFLDAGITVRRGDPLSLRYTLRNPGTLVLDATPVRVQLRAADDGALITQDSYAVSLAVGAEITRTSTFATGTLATGGYRVGIAAELRDAAGQSVWTELASLDVQIRQGCPAGRPIDLLFRNNFDGDLDDPLYCDDFEGSPGKPEASFRWLPSLLFAPARLPSLGADAAAAGDSR